MAELRKRGVHVSVCTGRMYSGTRDIAREVGVLGPVGCLDGSQVVDTSDDSDVQTHPIASHAAEPLLEALAEFDPVTFVFADDRVLHDDRGKRYLSFVSIWSRRSQHLPSVLDPKHFRGEHSVAALVSLGHEELIRAAATRIHERAGEHLQVAFFSVKHPDLEASWGMVVRAAGVSKATALGSIASHYGVSLQETVAVGDWVNDVSMLQSAGLGFAMGQAPDDVKQAADEVLDADSRKGGGIYEAAERAGLI